jgi:type II secretory pathway component PulK
MNPSTSEKDRTVRHRGLRVVGAVLVLALMVVLVGAIVEHISAAEADRRPTGMIAIAQCD